MKTVNKISIITALITLVTFGLSGPTMAATNPVLGAAGSFGVLSSTFSATSTTVNGDVGYTTLAPSGLTVIGGSIFMPSPPQAGLAQGLALADLNGQGCTFTFGSGAVDLSTDTTHGPMGIYTGGVYCAPAAMSIGTTGITLSGAGTFIFRSAGALNTVANSKVDLTGGADACNVFWTPVATTLGADSTFKGTVIDNAAITVLNNVSWTGRALDFATTVTTTNATITNTCVAATAHATLHVIKTVIGGTAVASGFNLYVNYNGSVIGSGVGTGSPGTLYSLIADIYTVTEGANSLYTQSLSADCSGVTLLSGDNKTCTITNTYITPPSGGGGGGGTSRDNCPNGDYSSSYYDGICGTAPIVATGSVHITTTGTTVKITSTNTTGTITTATGTITTTNGTNTNGTTTTDTTTKIPGLPKTGLFVAGNKTQWNIIAFASILLVLSTSLVVVIRKRRV